MSINLRDEIHRATDRLPDEFLSEVLHLMQTLIASSGNAELEAEEKWLLTSGVLKRMVDDLKNAPPSVKDWRSHLRGL